MVIRRQLSRGRRRTGARDLCSLLRRPPLSLPLLVLLLLAVIPASQVRCTTAAESADAGGADAWDDDSSDVTVITLADADVPDITDDDEEESSTSSPSSSTSSSSSLPSSSFSTSSAPSSSRPLVVSSSSSSSSSSSAFSTPSSSSSSSSSASSSSTSSSPSSSSSSVRRSRSSTSSSSAAPAAAAAAAAAAQATKSYIIHLSSAPPVLTYRGGLLGFKATAIADDGDDDDDSVDDDTNDGAFKEVMGKVLKSHDGPVADALESAAAAVDSAAKIAKAILKKVESAAATVASRLKEAKQKAEQRAELNFWSQRPRTIPDLLSQPVKDFQQFLEQSQRRILSSMNIPEEKIFQSSTFTANSFAATLTAAEVKKLKKHPAVAAIEPDVLFTKLTTDSPRFLKLPETLWPATGGQDSAGEGMVIGIVDTGIWPEHPSFADPAYKPYSRPPRRWRGKCEKRADFSACNRKVIGARFFSKGFKKNMGSISSTVDYLSARDADGHGTWCAGAAAGNGHVQYAAGTGYSYGNTSGMAPRARLAIYKVLWKQSDGQSFATYSDIRAAVDAAVSDGVDVLSISLGGSVPSYFSDIAYINAAKAGVFVVMAAGNAGRPNPKKLVGTIGNASPFYLTVGASSISRYYNLQITLGDGSQIIGVGTTPPPTGSNGSLALIGTGMGAGNGSMGGEEGAGTDGGDSGVSCSSGSDNSGSDNSGSGDTASTTAGSDAAGDGDGSSSGADSSDSSNSNSTDSVDATGGGDGSTGGDAAADDSSSSSNSTSSNSTSSNSTSSDSGSSDSSSSDSSSSTTIVSCSSTSGSGASTAAADTDSLIPDPSPDSPSTSTENASTEGGWVDSTPVINAPPPSVEDSVPWVICSDTSSTSSLSACTAEAPAAGAVLVVGNSASPSGTVSTLKLKRKTPQAGMFATLKEVAAGAAGRPAIVLSVEHGEILRKYLESTDNPSAVVTASWTAIDPTAPVVASFSSAGPVISPRFKLYPPFTPTNNILKPDIIGPGCDLVAAMPGDSAASATDNPADQSAGSDGSSGSTDSSSSSSSSGDTSTDGSSSNDTSTSGGDSPGSASPNTTSPGTMSGLGGSTLASGWSLNPQYPQSRDFTYLSGTSMSTPHIAGVAALIMQRRPHWTPAQVMSALMTTAYNENGVKKPIQRDAKGEATPFDVGAGHVNPSRALDPGLTYNARFRSYLRFLAGQSFIRTKRFFPFVPFLVPMRAYNLNRASISVTNLLGVAFVTRRATNVYSETSTYKASIDAPKGVKVSVWPTKFMLRPGQSATYVVTIASLKPVGEFRFGSITWVDNHGHKVRSPIVVRSRFT
ncbi:hypothetical protein CLOM_g3295 [Closterium sp. NIES-68]|nr:hypothetical protein CLOM_g3295 [Closterium sp. NIES-68]GJP73089.1 hypothetical protein CLOP_g3838 [Closterium sp. NIES-67]